MAAVLSGYAADIVALAADPRTGIAGQQKFLPAVAEIKQFCDDAATRQARIAHYASLPRPQRSAPRPINREPNLFVPMGFPRYDKMAARAQKEPGRCRFERGRVCSDGLPRDGLWAPLDWWQSDTPPSPTATAEASRRAFERECQAAGVDPARGVSPSLLKTLQSQAEGSNAEGEG